MTQPGSPAPARPVVLVLASTFPASDQDHVPAFVRDQVTALALARPDLDLAVLAPHDARSGTRGTITHEHFVEHRFHYFWPRSAERLAGRGIMPTLRAHPALHILVPFFFLGELLATIRLVRRIRPALIYAHWFTPQGIVASLVSALTRTPFVLTTHASDAEVWRRFWIGPAVVRRTCRRASGITAVSRRSLLRLTSFFPDGSLGVPTSIIPMGVHLPTTATSDAERHAARVALGLGAETVYLFIGRLVEKKGLDFLLQALARAGDGLGTWTLVVAGSGPELPNLRRTAEDLGICAKVRFVGFVSGETKRHCFRAADALVVPSVVASDGDTEGLPVSLLEGLAAGLPCIATRESGADDILADGANGLLCNQRDADGLLEALRRLYALTPAERQRLGERAAELSRDFAWGPIAERHYDTLLEPAMRERAARS